ncbi:MAG: T9SS type A sorting domain-containing protein [Candidatus Kapaibacteriota bacterium]
MIKFTKILAIILMFVLSQIPLRAQFLRIVGDTVLSYEANLDETYEILFTTQVQNTSFADLNVKVKVKVLEITEGHSFDVCWAGGCLPPAKEDWDKSPSDVIKGGATLPTNAFYSHYYPYSGASDPKPGTGKLVYTFYDADNPSDNASVTVSFKYYSGSGIIELPQTNSLSINLNEQNTLEIKLNQNDNYTISIYDTRGNMMLTSTFNSDKNIDLNNFSNGAYVFSIINSESKKVTTGKFIKK